MAVLVPIKRLLRRAGGKMCGGLRWSASCPLLHLKPIAGLAVPQFLLPLLRRGCKSGLAFSQRGARQVEEDESLLAASSSRSLASGTAIDPHPVPAGISTGLDFAAKSPTRLYEAASCSLKRPCFPRESTKRHSPGAVHLRGAGSCAFVSTSQRRSCPSSSAANSGFSPARLFCSPMSLERS